MKDRVDAKLDDLLKNPRPPGLRFEKLKGYRRPNIYTIHDTGNYKTSLAIAGADARLRRVGPHNYIGRHSVPVDLANSCAILAASWDIGRFSGSARAAAGNDEKSRCCASGEMVIEYSNVGEYRVPHSRWS